jgi:hypothetical protein
MYNKYLKYKIKYLNLKNQNGGANSDLQNDYEIQKLHNLYYMLDKGTNNIWMLKNKDKKSYDSYDKFKEYVIGITEKRDHTKIFNLENLMIKMSNETNLNFIEEFYLNMFKGSVYKIYIDESLAKLDEMNKRYKIYSEWYEVEGTAPEQRYYIFYDSSNPCHIINITQDIYKRSEELNKENDYAFIRTKILGKGAAGTAILIEFNDVNSKKFSVVAKTMENVFSNSIPSNNIPLTITYLLNDKINKKVLGLGNDNRFLLTDKIINYIDENFNNIYGANETWSKYNIFKTNHDKYKNIYLSVASNNFTNQTIMHIILDNILKKHETTKNNYIKQYDALFCYNYSSGVLTSKDKSLLDTFWSALKYSKDAIARQFTSRSITGLNFMETADDDLYNHLFNLHRDYFPGIRSNDDIKEDNFKVLNTILSSMITDILRPLYILQHPKYSFIHGDLKTKNIFVKKKNDKNITLENLHESYYYKIADYDKSAISYNGIRFYNEGNLLSNTYKLFFGTPLYNFIYKNDDVKSQSQNQEQSTYLKMFGTWMSYLNKQEDPDNKLADQIFYNAFGLVDRHLRPIKIMENEVLNAKNIFLLDESILKHIDIFSYKYKIYGKKESFELEIKKIIKDKFTKLLGKLSNTNFKYELAKFNMFIEERNNKLIEIHNKEIVKHGLEQKQNSDKKYSTEVHISQIINNYMIILDNQLEPSIFYNINSITAKIGMFVESAQQIEVEQLYVRYSNIPFYNTIDLYTLFLSLMQSPLIYSFIKYCILNKDKDHVKNSVFWKAFKPLWIENDIWVLLGYYEYNFKFPSTIDVGTIGFILDPLRKNTILLLKKTNSNYWKNILLELNDTSDYYNLNTDSDKKIDLSVGGFIEYPQICLTDKSNFRLNIHRDGKLFYTNKNTLIYNSANIGEKVGVITKQELSKENIRKKIYDIYLKQIKEYYTNIDSYLKLHNVNIITISNIATSPEKNNLLEYIFINRTLNISNISNKRELIKNLCSTKKISIDTSVDKKYLEYKAILKILHTKNKEQQSQAEQKQIELEIKNVENELLSHFYINIELIKQILNNEKIKQLDNRIKILVNMILINKFCNELSKLSPRNLSAIIEKISDNLIEVDINQNYMDFIIKQCIDKDCIYIQDINDKNLDVENIKLFVSDINSFNYNKNNKLIKEYNETKKIIDEYKGQTEWESLNKYIIDILDDKYDLNNVCKTNIYKPYLNGIFNWDYAYINNTMIKELLDKIPIEP